MRPRRGDGSWAEPWTPWAWGGAYVEGGPWQHSWTVPHDLDGLAELAGGREALADRLEAVFTTPPRAEPGAYGEEIHEMTEMALAADAEGRSFGQYAHSNQPSHAILWQLVALGRRDFAREQLARITRDLYTPDRFPGDEDNGEMAAWFVLATLGRYRLCPGSTGWAAGTAGRPLTATGARRLGLSPPSADRDALKAEPRTVRGARRRGRTAAAAPPSEAAAAAGVEDRIRAYFCRSLERTAASAIVFSAPAAGLPA